MSELSTLFDRQVEPNQVFTAFMALIEAEPKLRRKEIADKLDIPEASLIDHQCGVKSIRLNDQFKQMIEQLPSLGYIMSLTRNNAAVHERHGIYSNVKITGPMGLVITPDKKIDLRIILPKWRFGFAVTETTPRGERFSLQFFDQAGIAIQKIYLQPDSDKQAYRELVSTFRTADQSNDLSFNTEKVLPEYASDNQVDRQKLRQDWANMTDVHQFFGILRRHKVSREQAFRLTGKPYAQEISPTVLEQVLNQTAQQKLPIMCFVGNQGNIQIHTGEITNIKVMGPWLNILDPEFNLHLMQPEITSAWLVRKPTEDGIVTSLEFYDSQGETVAQFFGVRQEGNPENPQWRELAESTLEKDMTK